MTESVGVAGYRGLRGEILQALRAGHPSTAKELAQRFGVTANALRRHLLALEADGMVRHRREVRGVGGPTFAYALTEAGERLFPGDGDAALDQILDLLRDQMGTEGVVALFRRRWAAIAERAKPELARLPLPQRAARLAELLTGMGYQAEAAGAAALTLREHHCAIRAVIDRFPEICVAEAQFLEEVLGAHVTRQRHIAAGEACCEYCIHAGPDAPAGDRPVALRSSHPARASAPSPVAAP